VRHPLNLPRPRHEVSSVIGLRHLLQAEVGIAAPSALAARPMMVGPPWSPARCARPGTGMCPCAAALASCPARPRSGRRGSFWACSQHWAGAT
jgi:hypothetical protein